MALNKRNPAFLIAGTREAGVSCPHCGVETRLGDEVVTCPACGVLHHAPCWRSHDGCGSFDCAPAHRDSLLGGEASLKVTSKDLAAAVPMQPTRTADFSFKTSTITRRWNRLAIASLVVALAGIPLFGALTGLVAVVLGSIALGSIQNTRNRGTGLAISGVILGLVDMVAWIAFISYALSQPMAGISITDFEPDVAAVDNAEPHISRALKANVMIETGSGWRNGMGSGIIIDVTDGTALIVTNRHVIDPSFAAAGGGDTSSKGKAGNIQVSLLDKTSRPGTVLWIAPDGIDLALVSTIVDDDVEATKWRRDTKMNLGMEVFAVGNPHGLGWTHTQGVISQFRIQHRGSRTVRLIQTNTAINPGNSGGGLYDKDGTLVGINTYTNDRRVSEGISFAITFESLLKLNPPPLKSVQGSDSSKEITDETNQTIPE